MRTIELRTTEQSAVYGEARSLADEISYRRGYEMTYDEFINLERSVAFKSFRRDIEPLLKMKRQVVGLVIPVRVYYQDEGRIEVTNDGLTPEMREALDMIDGLINDVAKRYDVHYFTNTSHTSACE